MRDGKVLAVICARGGSKGLPGKNLKLIGKETLLARVIRHAKNSKLIDDLVVTTDDQKLADEATRYGAMVPFLRPKELSGDLATTEETLQHAITETESILKKRYEICVFLTATDIFRSQSWIDEAITKLQDNPKIESVFVGYKTHKNFWEKDEKGNWVRLKPWMKKYSSRQIRRFVVREDTGLACASRASLWREGRRIGDNVDIIIQDDDSTSIDIHTKDDLDLANYVLSRRTNSNELTNE